MEGDRGPRVIGIVGGGALGVLFAALLARSGSRVILVDADPRVVEAVREKGLVLEAHGERITARAEAYLPHEAPLKAADAVLVAVKAYHTRSAAPVAARLTSGVVATIQNGLGNYEVLEAHAPGRVVQGVTTWGATKLAPGVSRLGGRGEVVLGPPPPRHEQSHQALVGALEEAGLKPRVTGEVWRHLWLKVAVNAGINPVTALSRRRNRAVVEDPYLWSVASQAAAEVALVAEAEGWSIGGPQAAVETLRRVALATGENKSSMLQDVEACRPTEIEAINGEVSRRAEKHGLEAPVNTLLYRLVKGLEEREECRGPSATS